MYTLPFLPGIPTCIGFGIMVVALNRRETSGGEAFVEHLSERLFRRYSWQENL
jgi:hypothetical protein